ncbi:MAG: hypothetical protein WEB62_02715, partial [Bacteroidota bacterium]
MNPSRFHADIKLLAILLSILLLPLAAQERKQLTLDTMSDPSFAQAFSTPRTWWLDDNTALIYDTRKPADERVIERLDPASGKRTPYYDYRKATES